MSDSTQNPPEDFGKKRGRRVRVSWAWLVPVLAAAAIGWVAYSEWHDRGPEITIQFDEAPGIQPNKTNLFFRGVVAGDVTSVQLTESLGSVRVKVQLKAFAADLAREGTLFWVEKPVISLEELSGLESIIEGNSIRAREGTGPPATEFVGLDAAPLETMEADTVQFVLQAGDIPLLERGAPVLSRGATIGKVAEKRLAQDGSVEVILHINDQSKDVIRENSRFWFLPATSIDLGRNGLRLNIGSLEAILYGGVETAVFGEPGSPATTGTTFELSSDEFAARCSGAKFEIQFDNGLGLIEHQTRITYLGVPIGQIIAVTPDTETNSVRTVARLQPEFDSLLRADSDFSVLRPRLSLEGVTGLETIATGVVVELLPGKSNEPKFAFVGRSAVDPALGPEGVPVKGLRAVLSAKEIPNIGPGAQVIHRGVPVGKVIAKQFNADGLPEIEVVIGEEYAGSVHENSRFWRVAATSVEAGPGVLRAEIGGFETLLQGAVAFETFGAAGAQADSGDKFQLFPDERTARTDSVPIEIVFPNGHGLLAGQTQLRYLGLPIGLVEEVKVEEDAVRVTARVQAPYDFVRREGSVFQIIRPEISLKGVSGLETLVSGVFIECFPAESGNLATKFDGTSPAEEVDPPALDGLDVFLVTNASSLDEGSQIYYRDLAVGEITEKKLSPDSNRIVFKATIRHRFAPLVRENTRFWDDSGLTANLGPIKLRIRSAVIPSGAGRVAFATPPDPEMGAQAEEGSVFILNPEPRSSWLKWEPNIPIRPAK